MPRGAGLAGSAPASAYTASACACVCPLRVRCVLVCAFRVAADNYAWCIHLLSHPPAHASSHLLRRVHCRGVSAAQWESLVRSVTLAAWQAEVSRLVSDARAQGRLIELGA